MSSQTIIGGSLPKSSLSASKRGLFATVNQEWAFLIGVGLLGVITHASIHFPLKLPGHHGLEWMAMLMFARTITTSRTAATIAAASAAGFSYLPVWGFHETSIGLSFLLAGWVVDAGYSAVQRRHLVWLGVLAALAHVVKPLWKWLATTIVGVHFGSIDAGLGFTVLCHLAYGAVGGIAGAVAGRALMQKLKPTDEHTLI